LRAEAVVIATGNNAAPLAPDLPGLAAFKGRVLHSAAYRNATPFAGQNVLVVGMGNTGAEIALDLAESGARPTVSVRGGLHVVPRELFGLPIQVVGMLGRWMPVALSDRLLPPILDLAQGRLDRYGLSRPKEGMLRQIAARGRIPLIDVGTVAAIRRGDIRVAPGIASLTGTGARFADGGSGDFDAIILATGYLPNYRDFLDAGVPVGQSGVDRQASAQRLYLVGFRNPASGLLREIGIEAKAVADDIRRQTGNAARQ
jgi:cation diffusion facilitator CzcD-associated flavoprotein CzcO